VPGRGTGRVKASALAGATVALLLASCTGDGGNGTVPSPTGSPPAPPTAPGSYVYDFNGVTATFRLHGDDGSLEIRNGAGIRLGPPELSILAADAGEPLVGSLSSAGPLPSGARETFDVALPEALHPRDVGLVVLSFGTDVWGAFSPSRPGG
jgi:hypothetical protein